MGSNSPACCGHISVIGVVRISVDVIRRLHSSSCRFPVTCDMGDFTTVISTISPITESNTFVVHEIDLLRTNLRHNLEDNAAPKTAAASAPPLRGAINISLGVYGERSVRV